MSTRNYSQRKPLPRFLLPLFVICFCVCLVAVGVICWGYFQGNRMYNSVAQSALPNLDASDDQVLDTRVDWDALREVNPETVAWVYVPDTEINYPIVQAENNEKYLKTDFQGEVNWAVSYGAIFLDSNCAADFSDRNSFFYGHNMNNGAMFAALANFSDDQVFNNHRTVYLFTPECNYRLKSFAFLHVPSTDSLVQSDMESDIHQRAYLQTQIDRSLVHPSEGFPNPGSIGHAYVLVTCDNLPSDGRYVLYCREVESR